MWFSKKHCKTRNPRDLNRFCHCRQTSPHHAQLLSAVTLLLSAVRLLLTALTLLLSAVRLLLSAVRLLLSAVSLLLSAVTQLLSAVTLLLSAHLQSSPPDTILLLHADQSQQRIRPSWAWETNYFTFSDLPTKKLKKCMYIVQYIPQYHFPLTFFYWDE